MLHTTDLVHVCAYVSKCVAVCVFVLVYLTDVSPLIRASDKLGKAVNAFPSKRSGNIFHAMLTAFTLYQIYTALKKKKKKK